MADKYKWYAQKDGQTIEKSCKELQEITGLSEYQINASMKTGRRYKGWLIYREVINYDDAIYDVVDGENNIIFTGTSAQATLRFGFKKIDLKDYINRGIRLKKKYRVFRHNEFEKPKYHPESVDVANMLKIHGNTIANGRTLERVLKELKEMGIRVDVEKSSTWKNWYILTRRENAETRS